MKAVLSLAVVAMLMALVLGGVGLADQHFLFGVVLPYAALIVFIAGFVYRVLKWARVPVPFRITTTAGQQKSLPWIKDAPLDCPSNTLGVIVRLALEVLLFRSLFRNTKVGIVEGQKVVYLSNKILWAAGLAFHWSLLVILIRHFRFFVEPVPFFVPLLEGMDSFFQVGLPLIYASDAVFLAALTWLFIRRVCIPQIRYISLPADYFPLILLLSIASTGILMRYFFKVDTVGAKELAAGLLSFRPSVPDGMGLLFYLHLFLVTMLIAYFPFSKLMHMAGIFMSPTRNMANDNRMRRHVNPWDYPVKTHTYEEYEDEFREKMVDAGIPVDKES